MPGQPDDSASSSSSSSTTSATTSSTHKPELLITFACVDPTVYEQLSSHFTLHTVCLPMQLHPAISGHAPTLPVPSGEGHDPSRRWQDWACSTPAQVVDYLHRHPVDALLCVGPTSITRDVLQAASPRLRHVATVSVGYNHIDVDEAVKQGVSVSNVPGTLDETTADLTVALMLAAARRLIEAAQAVKEGTWTVWRNQWMLGKDVAGSTVGIVGLGRIGMRVAHRLHFGFGCRVLYCGQREKPTEAAKVHATFVSFDDLLQQSDFVVPQCPLTPATRHMFSTAQFARMKRDAVFINTTRGAVVDQDALLAALRDGTIAAAGLDVTDPEPLPSSHPLVAQSNCVIFPHIGSATHATRLRMLQTAATNVIHTFAGKGEKVLLVDECKNMAA